jgi:ribosomal protein S18 acetylase RimI-like enzyme
MIGFRLVPYERKYSYAVKDCARKAWQFTYAKIFTPAQIDEYIEKFYSEQSERDAEQLISEGLVRYVVAIDEAGNLLGFHSASVRMLLPELTRIYILPETIGEGLGSALLADAEDFFLRKGFKYYQLKVHRQNAIGQKFYEKKGFIFQREDDHEHFVLRKEL